MSGDRAAIALKAIHHVRFAVPDIDSCARFCCDFGLTVAERGDDHVYMRGSGTHAYSFVAERGEQTDLRGIAFLVEEETELQRAVEQFGATAVRPLDGPGGGQAVTLHDPDGLPIDLVYGIADVQPLPLRSDLQLNTPENRVRLGARQVPHPPGPAQVIRLGHVGLFVTDYMASAAWYGEALGFLLSDGAVAGPNQRPVVGFFRLDRGTHYVDHHSLALFAGQTAGAQHLSFEVQDFEAQMIAHKHMLAAGWQPLWGVGRHGLGSHIFDVWWEPNDLRFETYSDTDLFTVEKPGEYFDAGPELTAWGPDMPMEYLHPRGTPGIVGGAPT